MRWVLLEHDWDGIHFDLLIEQEEACLTFAFESDPFEVGGGKSVRKPDHRKHYLTYEGPVSDDRGSVRRVRSGSVDSIEASEDRISVRGKAPESFRIIFKHESETNWGYRIYMEP